MVDHIFGTLDLTLGPIFQISGSIKRIADFLNSFDMSCRSRLSTLNEKLTTLERKVDFLEAKVSRGETPI